MPTHCRLPEAPEGMARSQEPYVRFASLARCLSSRGPVAIVLMALAIAGCGSGGGTASGVDPTPERIDGTSSYEFEQEDQTRPKAPAMPLRTTAPTQRLRRSAWGANRTSPRMRSRRRPGCDLLRTEELATGHRRSGGRGRLCSRGAR